MALGCFIKKIFLRKFIWRRTEPLQKIIFSVDLTQIPHWHKSKPVQGPFFPMYNFNNGKHNFLRPQVFLGF